MTTIFIPCETTPPQKWRVEPSRMSSGSILLFRQSEGQTTTVKISQRSLSNQLGTLVTHWNLSSDERLMSIESSSSEFLIVGVILPLYLGCDWFLLPPQLAKQSPEVWGRIVQRHAISLSDINYSNFRTFRTFRNFQHL